MNKKHYVVYFKGDGVVCEPSKEWARNNKECFPKYTFENSDKEPISNEIALYLVKEKGFTLISDDEKLVCYKLTN